MLLLECATRGGANAVDFGEEKRRISEAVARGHHGNAFVVADAPALRWEDLLLELDRFRPSIVHFSGHGTQEAALRMRTADGGLAPMSSEGLCSLLAALDPRPVLVVLNVCWSLQLAQRLIQWLPCTVGIEGEISDRAAIGYARNLYGMLANGNLISYAHRMSVAMARTHGLEEWDRIRLFTATETAASRGVISAVHLPPEAAAPIKPDATAAVLHLRGSPEAIDRARSVMTALEAPDLRARWLTLDEPSQSPTPGEDA